MIFHEVARGEMLRDCSRNAHFIPRQPVMMRFLDDIVDYPHYPRDLVMRASHPASPRHADVTVLANASSRDHVSG